MINLKYKRRTPRLRKVNGRYEIATGGKTYRFKKKPTSKKSKKFLSDLIYSTFAKLVRRGFRNAKRRTRKDRGVPKSDPKKPAIPSAPSTFGYSTFATPKIIADRAPMFYPGGFYQHPQLLPAPAPAPLLQITDKPPPLRGRPAAIEPSRSRAASLPHTTSMYHEVKDDGPRIEVVPDIRDVDEAESRRLFRRTWSSPGKAVSIRAFPVFSDIDGEQKGRKGVVLFNQIGNFKEQFKTLSAVVEQNDNKQLLTGVDEKNRDFEKLKELYDKKEPGEYRTIVKFYLQTDRLEEIGSGKKLKHTQDGAGISDNECNNLMQSWAWYQGCIMRDELGDVLEDAIQKQWDRWGIIINTQSSAEGNGLHWCAIYCDILFDRSIEYFDPFGDPPHVEIEHALKEYMERLQLPYMLKFKVNTNKLQHEISDSCGYHSMLFLEDRFLGVPFMQATGWEKKKRLVTDSEHRVTKKFGLI